MTCHVCREFFVPNYNIFSVLSIFKCNPGKTNNKIILLNNLYPVIYRQVQKKKKVTNYCIQFGHSLSVNQLPTQRVNKPGRPWFSCYVSSWKIVRICGRIYKSRYSGFLNISIVPTTSKCWLILYYRSAE